jgi:hypothetical protein
VSDERIIVKSTDMGALVGPIWFGGWMFTLGYLGLHMPKAFFALVIWPYYLGMALR